MGMPIPRTVETPTYQYSSSGPSAHRSLPYPKAISAASARPELTEADGIDVEADGEHQVDRHAGAQAVGTEISPVRKVANSHGHRHDLEVDDHLASHRIRVDDVELSLISAAFEKLKHHGGFLHCYRCLAHRHLA